MVFLGVIPIFHWGAVSHWAVRFQIPDRKWRTLSGENSDTQPTKPASKRKSEVDGWEPPKAKWMALSIPKNKQQALPPIYPSTHQARPDVRDPVPPVQEPQNTSGSMLMGRVNHGFTAKPQKSQRQQMFK